MWIIVRQAWYVCSFVHDKMEKRAIDFGFLFLFFSLLLCISTSQMGIRDQLNPLNWNVKQKKENWLNKFCVYDVWCVVGGGELMLNVCIVQSNEKKKTYRKNHIYGTMTFDIFVDDSSKSLFCLIWTPSRPKNFNWLNVVFYLLLISFICMSSELIAY